MQRVVIMWVATVTACSGDQVVVRPPQHPPVAAGPAAGARPWASVRDRLEHLDRVFGTSGELPAEGGDVSAVSRAGLVRGFVRSRLAQPAFYDTTLPVMFDIFGSSMELKGSRMSMTALEKGVTSKGKTFWYRRAPCPPGGLVAVDAWWAPGQETLVCAKDHVAAVKSVKSTESGAEEVVPCDGPLGQAPGTACGCGERLDACSPPELADAMEAELFDEPIRTIQHVVQNDRAFGEILTMNGSVRTDLADHYYDRASYRTAPAAREGGEGGGPRPGSEPRLRPRPSEFDGGVMTMPVFRYYETPRTVVAMLYLDFLCMPFKSVAVNAKDVLGLSHPNLRTKPVMELAEKTGCQNCHRRLENAMLAFSAWPLADVGMYPDRARAVDSSIQFYVRDHHDLRAEGPAAPVWLGSQMAAQAEFGSCIVGKVEALVYGGYPVPAPLHERLIRDFAAKQSFARTLETAVVAWVTGR